MNTAAPTRREAVLLGLGEHRAERTLTNADLEARLDTSDEWIRKRTGIVTRRLAGPEETIAGMGADAGAKALAAAGGGAAPPPPPLLAARPPPPPPPRPAPPPPPRDGGAQGRAGGGHGRRG